MQRPAAAVEAEMAALLAELADPVRLSVVAGLAAGPLGLQQVAEAAGREPGEVGPHLAALVALDIVRRVEGPGGAEYRLADPEVAEACSALRSVIVCRVATTKRLDQFVLPDRRRRRRAAG